MLIFKSGTYDGLFVSTDFPIVNDIQGYFDLRGSKKYLIPEYKDRDKPTLLIRSTGSEGIVTVSVVYFAQDQNLRDGFFSITACETVKNVSKNFKKFLTISIASIISENLKNQYYDIETSQINGIPKLKDQNSKPKNINYLPRNFDFNFSQGFSVNWLEKSGLLEISNILEKENIFNQLVDGFEIFFNVNHPQSFEHCSFLIRANIEKKLKDEEKEKNILAKKAIEQKRKLDQARIQAKKEELDTNLKNFNQLENSLIQKLIYSKIFFPSLLVLIIIVGIIFYLLFEPNSNELKIEQKEIIEDALNKAEVEIPETEFLECINDDEIDNNNYHLGLVVNDGSRTCPKVKKEDVSNIFNKLYSSGDIEFLKIVKINQEELQSIFDDPKDMNKKGYLDRFENIFILLESNEFNLAAKRSSVLFNPKSTLLFSRQNALNLFCSNEILVDDADMPDPYLGIFKSFPKIYFLAEPKIVYEKNILFYTASTYSSEYRNEYAEDIREQFEKINEREDLPFFKKDDGNFYKEEFEKIYETINLKLGDFSKLEFIYSDSQNKNFYRKDKDDNREDLNNSNICIFTSNHNQKNNISTFANFKNVELYHLSTPIDSEGLISRQKRSCYGWPSWYLVAKNEVNIVGSKFIEVEKTNQNLKINEIIGPSDEKTLFHMLNTTKFPNEILMSNFLEKLYKVFTKFKNTRLLKEEDNKACKPEQLIIHNQGL